MLYQSGLIALGKMQNPLAGVMTLELDEVQSIIELLELLEEKTKGNLSGEEEKTLAMILETMRTNYLEELNKTEGGKGEPSNGSQGSKNTIEGDNFEIH